jgi:hypothetical protein
MQTTDIAQIAAKLTKAQRKTVLELSGAWKLVSPTEIVHTNKKGLTSSRATSFGGTAGRLTPLGQQVRALLRKIEGDPA